MTVVTKRYFTLEEARRELPRIRKVMGDAISLSHRMEEFCEELQVLADKAVCNSGSPAGTVYLGHLLELQQLIGRIQDRGCLVKSVQDGLVDFPHWKDGREVYLCWRFDEEDISYYHEVEEGFRGRKPI